MRGTLIGTLAGLVIGTLGTLGYSHLVGAGSQLAQAQVQLDSTTASLAKATAARQEQKAEADSQSAQIQQLAATNKHLEQQVATLKAAPPAPAAPVVNPLAGMMRAGANQMNQEKLLLLKSRLHLTPEQVAAVQAAMDAQTKEMEEMSAKMFQGGKIDPAAFKNMKNMGSVDTTLDQVLTPDQKTAYAQLKADEKTSQSENVATSEMNQMAPLLQLSDAQKDQVYSTLYQHNLDMQDPAWIKSNIAGSTNPADIMAAQAQAKEDALAKILTPAQLVIYRQQAQSQLEMQQAMVRRFAPGVAAPVPAAH